MMLALITYSKGAPFYNAFTPVTYAKVPAMREIDPKILDDAKRNFGKTASSCGGPNGRSRSSAVRSRTAAFRDSWPNLTLQCPLLRFGDAGPAWTNANDTTSRPTFT